jgi:hypothetical protein
VSPAGGSGRVFAGSGGGEAEGRRYNMKAKIELVKKEGNTLHTIELPGHPKGPRILEVIDKQVNKQFGADKGWERWNLVALID